MIKTKKSRFDSAVSPVIGVLLMLVVTIIIAAIVSGFAGGLVGDQKKTPQATLDVKINGPATNMEQGMSVMNYSMTFEHNGGDPLNTKDLAIITYYTNKTGYTYKHEQNASSPSTCINGTTGDTMKMPYLNDWSKGWTSSTPAVWWGNFTWTNGEKLSTYYDQSVADLLGINDQSTPHKIMDPDFGVGSKVDIEILHKPSGRDIVKKEVTVI